MSLSLGIIGLPNVGKSTVFNALTRAQQATVASYPFATIEPNRAVVPVPDGRLSRLQELLNVQDAIPAAVTFVDIAGLVEGASRGEGLGNQFLAHIRQVDAILHIVRCFHDPNVAHVRSGLDPEQDIRIIEKELIAADMAQIERKIQRLEDDVKGDRDLLPVLEAARTLHAHLEAGQPASTTVDDSPELRSLNAELRPLTAKPVIYCANVAEMDSEIDADCCTAVRKAAGAREAQFLELRGKLEADLADTSDEEFAELLEIAGLQESALNRLIRAGYQQLDLITFFTFNDREVRAWTLPEGATAYQAAGKIHSDIQAGFIKAEVIPYEVFEQRGSSAEVRGHGELRFEGRDYIVQDGDILLFRFQ